MRRAASLERKITRLAEQNARQAWKHWFFNIATAEQSAAYYVDKPWRNPRLSEVERWRLQYEHDAELRAYDIQRAAEKKAKIKRATPAWANKAAIKLVSGGKR